VERKKRSFRQESSSKDIPWWRRWPPWTGWRGKTLWDWQALLFIPVSVALLAALFTQCQHIRQLELENQRAGAETLQAHLDQMGPLLLDKHLRSTEDPDVRNLARARTLATLDALEPERKRRLLRFLAETKLVNAALPEEQSLVNDCAPNKLPVIPPDRQPVVSLRYAQLEGIRIGQHGLLGGIDLQHADLANANISDADLSNTSLRGANLFEAILSSTDLSNVDLRGACLSNAYLSSANLSGADLRGANVTEHQLDQASSLEGATMPDGSKHP
jgi:hypothetical protein